MPCYKPLSAFQDANGTVAFTERKGANWIRTLTLPCGRCVGCRLERSRQWAVRCLHESKSNHENCFITLTYSEEHLPENMSLNYDVFQRFMKRLRKHFGSKRVRFYMCGEYGETNPSTGLIDGGIYRPHFHACLFGVDFPDKVLASNKGGKKLYDSKILERLWGFGGVRVGELNFETAAYTARYIMKKITGDPAEEHYSYVVPATGEIVQREPEFCHMSLKPGIGAEWLDKFHQDVYRFDYVVVRGREAKPPRYYDKRYAKRHEDAFATIQDSREVKSYARRLDNTDSRLAVKEVVAKARVSLFKRNL
ncbi:VP4 [Gokushovirus WZ-2015a]|nr:VP4 [Gokushovirus WZ-2015a]